jgi:FlaA1/EpsC-like NDP-sugar epimerase
MNNIKARYRRLCIVLYHSAAICASIVMAFLLRFEFLFPRGETPHLIDSLIIALFVKSLVFRFLGLDRGSWRYASLPDLQRILRANVIASVAFTVMTAVVVGRNFPRSVYFGDFLICFLLTAGGRFGLRVYRETMVIPARTKKQHRVLIYGAGQAGMMLLKETLANPALGYRVVGFLDDDPAKMSMNMMGVRVLGSGRRAPAIVSKCAKRNEPLEAILIAMPSATGRQMQEALANCRTAGIACKTVPGIAEMINGRVSIEQMRDVSVEDLLGRNPVHIDEQAVRQFLHGKSVMVSGAGGSIGSELCRKIARFGPLRLVAFDQAESDLFRIQMEMNERHGDVAFIPQIGDIRDMARVQEVIREHRINCIFHAAAYKHVPMMEAHALEAINNNVLGTRNIVEAAYFNGVSHFAMISSDKAVNPTNIMGLTKRIAELIVSSMPVPRGTVGTNFVSVRFGNVLGSNGSVVPLFKQQIMAGGPVTVTHPDVKRYFMTIPEAVELVLQATTMGKGSELFVLDMGQPIRIADLARNMIRLSGKDPDTEIEIRYTGLRPGEKLFEELMHEGEDILPTFHEKINIFRGASVVERAEIQRIMRELEAMLQRRDASGAVGLLWQLVPEYQPDVMWRKNLSETRSLAAEASA